MTIRKTLDLNGVIIKALKKANIITMIDLVSRTAEVLLQVRNIGKQRLKAIQRALRAKQLGLTLGMRF